MANLPVVDEPRIKSVFEELERMEVELDDDPLSFGPKTLNAKVGSVRRLLTRCERIFLQVSYDLQLYKRMHKASLADFDLQMQDLIANDPDVRAGRNVRDRDAIATMKLRKLREQIMGLEVSIQDLEMVMTVIKAKRADLRDLQGRLRDQIKLCQEEIGLGSRWGSRPPAGVSTPDLDAAPRISASSLHSIQELVGSASASEVHLRPGDSSWLADDNEVALLAQLARAAEDDEDEDDDESDEEAPAFSPPSLSNQPPRPVAPPVTEPPTETISDPVEEFDIFAEDTSLMGDVPAPAPIPSVSTDADVDRLFDRLESPENRALKGEILPPSVVEDLDSLIDMFGE